MTDALTILPPTMDVASIRKTFTKTDTGNPVLNHAMKGAELQGFWSERMMKTSCATVQVMAHGLTIEDWREVWEIQQAALHRLLTLQNGWADSWTKWLHYAGQVSGANSLFKLAERESNISAQFTQLLGMQTADLAGLQENVLIDYGYWLQQKLDEIKQSQTLAKTSA